MKRLLSIFASAMCLLTAAFAEEPTATPTPKTDSLVEGYAAATPAPTPELPPLREDPMLQHVVEIAHRIDLLAESELFISYTVGDGVVMKEQIDAVSRGDHSRPNHVYHLHGEALIEALYAGIDPAQRPDFTRPELLSDLVDELPEMFWGRREDAELYLLSTLSRYKIFASEGSQGCGLFVLLYEEGTPVLVTWTGWNGCINVAAFFMPDETLMAAANGADVSAWFSGIGMPNVPFEEVPLT